MTTSRVLFPFSDIAILDILNKKHKDLLGKIHYISQITKKNTNLIQNFTFKMSLPIDH